MEVQGLADIPASQEDRGRAVALGGQDFLDQGASDGVKGTGETEAEAAAVQGLGLGWEKLPD